MLVCNQQLLIAVRTQSGMQYSAEMPIYMWTPWYKMITVEKPVLNEMPEDYPRFFEHRYPSEAFYGKCFDITFVHKVHLI